MVARQQAISRGKTSSGLQTDGFINSRLSGSSRKVTVIKNLINKHQSGFEWRIWQVGDFSLVEKTPDRSSKDTLNQIHEWRRVIVFIVPVGFIMTMHTWKAKKPWHPAKTNNIMTIRVTRFSLHPPVTEWTAPYIIIAKGHFQLKLISKHKDIKIKFVIT